VVSLIYLPVGLPHPHFIFSRPPPFNVKEGALPPLKLPVRLSPYPPAQKGFTYFHSLGLYACISNLVVGILYGGNAAESTASFEIPAFKKAD
jgi:hypothetical protein